MNDCLPKSHKATVFLVEDNEDARFVLTCLLNEAGYTVHSAGTMRQALADFPAAGADVLVSDIGLPDGNGRLLLEGLRARGVAPFAVAVSGFGTTADVQATLAAGFDHHLVKPFDFGVLESLLENGSRRQAAQVPGGRHAASPPAGNVP